MRAPWWRRQKAPLKRRWTYTCNPEGSRLYTSHRENLKSHFAVCYQRFNKFNGGSLISWFLGLRLRSVYASLECGEMRLCNVFWLMRSLPAEATQSADLCCFHLNRTRAQSLWSYSNYGQCHSFVSLYLVTRSEIETDTFRTRTTQDQNISSFFPVDLFQTNFTGLYAFRPKRRITVIQL